MTTTDPTNTLRPRRPVATGGLLAASTRWGRKTGLTVVATLVMVVAGFWLKATTPDGPIVVTLNSWHSGLWGELATGIYRALSPLPALAIAVVLSAVVALIRRSLREGLGFGSILALAWLPTVVFKVLVDRPRPSASSLSFIYSPLQKDGSFPSGHTAFVTAVVVAFCYLSYRSVFRWLVVVLGIAAVAVVGTAVVSDGVHYPSDALASMFWVLMVTPLARNIAAALWRRRPQVRSS